MTRDIIISQLRVKGIQARPSGSDPYEIYLCCPYCQERGRSPDTEYKLGVNVGNSRGHCFRCGWKSLDALEQLQVVSVGAFVPQDTEEKKPIHLPDDFELLRKDDSDDWNKRAWNYLTLPHPNGRGIAPEQVKRKRIGFSLSGRYGGRIIFPIWGEDKKFLGFTSRTMIPGKKPKWKHSDGLKAVYPARFERDSDTVILSEGAADALVIARYVKMDSLGLLGTHITDEKTRWIRNYKNVILWFDNDKAGRDACIDEAEKLSPLFNVWIISGKRDPSEMLKEEIYRCCENRVSWNWSVGVRLLGGE